MFRKLSALNTADLNMIKSAGFLMCFNKDLIIVKSSDTLKCSFPKGKHDSKTNTITSSSPILKSNSDNAIYVDMLYQTAKRELKEETGLMNYIYLTSLEPSDIYVEYSENGYPNIAYFPAVFQLKTPEFKNKFIPNDEISEVVFLNIDQIKNLPNDFIKPVRKSIAIDFLSKQPDLNLTYTDTIMGNQRVKSISKKISYYLRHNLLAVQSNVSSDGYVDLKNLLKLSDFDNVWIEEIFHVVKNSDKKRFNIKYDDINNQYLIRANQGHSISESSKLINPMDIFYKITQPLEYCIHGTSKDKIDSIKSKGLKCMSRTHIHFASKPNAISGFRKTSDAFVHIDMAKAMTDGIEFYMSDNEVILSSGIDGTIDPKYFMNINIL